MGYQKIGAYTAIVDAATVPTVVGDGTLVSTLAGASYGNVNRFAVIVHATAAGAFTFGLKMRGFITTEARWHRMGLNGGDVNSGSDFEGTTADSWLLEGYALADVEALHAQVVGATGSPTVTVKVAPIGEGF